MYLTIYKETRLSEENKGIKFLKITLYDKDTKWNFTAIRIALHSVDS